MSIHIRTYASNYIYIIINTHVSLSIIIFLYIYIHRRIHLHTYMSILYVYYIYYIYTHIYIYIYVYIYIHCWWYYFLSLEVLGVTNLEKPFNEWNIVLCRLWPRNAKWYNQDYMNWHIGPPFQESHTVMLLKDKALAVYWVHGIHINWCRIWHQQYWAYLHFFRFITIVLVPCLNSNMLHCHVKHADDMF